MHDFGADVNLKGKHVVFKKTSFFRAGANRNTRTFVVDGGPGCEATKGTQRTLTGYWLSDNQRDTINSYELELYIDENGKDVPNPGAVVTTEYTPPLIVASGSKTVTVYNESQKLSTEEQQRLLESPSDKFFMEESTATPQNFTAVENNVAGVPYTKESESESKHVEVSNSRRKPYDIAKAVELYKQGIKIVDIAVEMGYARGQGQNRTRAALREAGVLK